MPATDPTGAIIEAVRRAWEGGRPVVPILGSGLSADAGIPVIASLQRYLCKYHQYVARQCYLPGLSADPTENPLAGRAADFRRAPAACVEEVGWPDRYELTQSLRVTAPGGDVEALVRRAERALVRATDGWADAKFRKLRLGAYAALREVRKEFRAELRADPARADRFRKVGRGLVGQLTRGADDRGVTYTLFANWRRLIQHFTGYRPELADGLFHRLVGNRRPSLGHRALAFLVKLLAVRSVFTFNFDDLIERALRGERLAPQVFAMEHGGALPAPALVRDALTVVKMHGSTHALLLDERLDYPLAPEYKERFCQIAGPEPLLLVAGFGTDERRLFDLLESALGAKESAAEVCWLHFEETTPPLLQALADKYPRRVLTAPTPNPGQTFQHLYAALVGRHPASRVAYPAHVHHPYCYTPVGEAAFKAGLGPAATAPFAVVTSAAVPDKEYPPRTASEWLIELATRGVRPGGGGLQPLWVDLEASNTLAAVVGSIVDQCRALDAQLAPSVMPLAGDLPAEKLKYTVAQWVQDPVVKAAAERVAATLLRHRYLVLLDGLEAYLWPPLVHHGEVAGRVEQDAALLNQLAGFLTALKDELGPNSGSRVVLGLDRSYARAEEWKPAELSKKYLALVVELERSGWVKHDLARPTGGYQEFEAEFDPPAPGEPLVRLKKERPPTDPPLTDEQWALVLLTLSCVRRGRPLATVRRLLRPLVRGRRADALVTALCTPHVGPRLGLTRLSGGALWYHRPVRDHVYAANSRACNTAVMSELLVAPPATVAPEFGGKVALAAAQAALLTATHLRVASVYYSNVYLQSLDAVQFLEYTYHRQSGVRYLAKLHALLRPPAYEPFVLAGLRRAGEYHHPDHGGGSAEDWRRLWDGLCPRAEFETTRLHAALTGATTPGPAAALRGELEGWHARELTALARAWVRAEPLLRVQLPAQQLAAWCDMLADDRDVHRHDRVMVRPRPDLAAEPYPRHEPLTPDIGKANDHLIGVVTDFRVKLLYDRADYDKAAESRLRQLEKNPTWPSLAAVTGAFRDVFEKREPPAVTVAPPASQVVAEDHLPHLHWLLDVAACAIKHGQETGAGLAPTRTLIDRVGGLLRAVEETAGRESADVREARLRWHYFRAEATIGPICVFTQAIGFVGRPADHLPDEQRADFLARQTEAEKDVELGMAAMRAAPPRADGRLRSLLLDPIDGGWLYLPYRSAFHTAQGRLRWLRAVRDVDATPDGVDEAFRTAFECFDLARGALEGNHQIAALNELFLVEACLARARITLYPAEGDDGDEVARRLRQAGAKYEAARGGLQAARSHLLTGRRNVMWWKLFYGLAAQYHADRLLADLARLAHGGVGSVGLWAAVARLRHGYQTVRNGLDVQEAPESAGAPRDSWLDRVWGELTGAAYLVARHLMGSGGKLGSEAQHAAAVNVVRGVHAACRLPAAWLEGAYADEWGWYEGLFDRGAGTAADVLYLRMNVLGRALRSGAWEAVWDYEGLREQLRR